MDINLIGKKIQWTGCDDQGICKTWNGIIVGAGQEGVVVEFEDGFDGHDGTHFDISNGSPINKNNNHWFFDYENDDNYKFTYLVEHLNFINESE